MKCFGRFLIVTTLFAACSHNPVSPEKQSYYSGTIPIANGNTWVYQHYYSYTAPSTLTGSLIYSHEQYRNGLFIVSIGVIDSFLLGGDSIVFTIGTVDSGVAGVIDNDTPVLNSSSIFVNREAETCLLTNKTLFVKDAGTGLWKADSSGSFLSYKVPPDSSYSYGPSGLSLTYRDYTRQSNSETVIMNNKNAEKLYTTGDAQPYGDANFTTNLGDTLRWLENTGLFYKSNDRHYTDNGTYVYQTTIENYSLISFNGSPISISQ